MNKKGFTLIELLIVVTIIGILAVALVPRIVGGSAAARDSRRQTDLQTLSTGLSYYLSENGDFEDVGGAGATSAGDTYCSDDSDISDALSLYIGAIPTDPQSTQTNTTFGDACTGSYTILFMRPSATDASITKFAVAANLENPVADADFTYDVPAVFARLDLLATALNATPFDTDGDGEGSYIVY